MLTDVLEVNERLKPDVVILDEAQRIKNWNTKTAMAVKRLRSRYAWVLTGTPIENRIDELYSLVSFLDPAVFGPLFRFNREFYEFDERGRPQRVPQSGRTPHPHTAIALAATKGGRGNRVAQPRGAHVSRSPRGQLNVRRTKRTKASSRACLRVTAAARCRTCNGNGSCAN